MRERRRWVPDFGSGIVLVVLLYARFWTVAPMVEVPVVSVQGKDLSVMDSKEGLRRMLVLGVCRQLGGVEVGMGVEEVDV